MVQQLGWSICHLPSKNYKLEIYRRGISVFISKAETQENSEKIIRKFRNYRKVQNKSHP